MGAQHSVHRAEPKKAERSERPVTLETRQGQGMTLPLEAQVGLLDMPGLGEVQRVSAVLRLQGSLGNRYVQRVMAKLGVVMCQEDEEDYSGDYEGEEGYGSGEGTWETESGAAQLEYIPPDQADLLIGGMYGQYLQEAIANGVAASGTVSIIDEERARQIWASTYGSTEESMAEFETVRGWADKGQTPWTSYVIEGRADGGTVVHEAIHLYSNNVIGELYGSAVDEGMTEFFTREITDSLGVSRTSYQGEWAGITYLVAIAGEEVVRSAYFEGNAGNMVATVDEEVGEGAFDGWWMYMQLGDWQGAYNSMFPSSEVSVT